MTYSRFEELPVWQEAIRLVDEVYNMTEQKEWPGSRSLQDHLERAAFSVPNNIAEGFARGTTNELPAFLYLARGSAGVVRPMLCFRERREGYAHFKSQISDLKSKAESCSRQARAWADHLQNSDIQGQRHLNEKTRSSYRSKNDTEEFQRVLREILPPDYSLRKAEK